MPKIRIQVQIATLKIRKMGKNQKKNSRQIANNKPAKSQHRTIDWAFVSSHDHPNEEANPKRRQNKTKTFCEQSKSQSVRLQLI